MSQYQTLSPSKFIPLSYTLADGEKAPTRFVRSVIKNAVTNAIIKVNGNEFVNLTDNGDGDFSEFSVTPASIKIAEDTFIRVITIVYKDSGFTQADTRRYAVKEEVYLIRTELGGAVLTGRQIGFISETVGARLDKIVKAFFRFNDWKDIKDENSFARKFLEIKPEIQNLDNSIKESSKSVVEDITKEIVDAETDILGGQLKFKEQITNLSSKISKLDLSGNEELEKIKLIVKAIELTTNQIQKDKKVITDNLKKTIEKDFSDFKEELKRIKVDKSQERITNLIDLMDEWVKKIEKAIPLLTQAEILEQKIFMRELQKLVTK